MHLSPIAILVLMNLCLAIFALVRDQDEDTSLAPNKRARWSTMGIVFAVGSQLLYSVFLVVGQSRSIHLYPGNPIEAAAILAGLTLCVVGFVLALFGEGLRRWAGVLYCATTTILWLLAAIVSVAV